MEGVTNNVDASLPSPPPRKSYEAFLSQEKLAQLAELKEVRRARMVNPEFTVGIDHAVGKEFFPLWGLGALKMIVEPGGLRFVSMMTYTEQEHYIPFASGWKVSSDDKNHFTTVKLTESSGGFYFPVVGILFRTYEDARDFRLVFNRKHQRAQSASKKKQ